MKWFCFGSAKWVSLLLAFLMNRALLIIILYFKFKFIVKNKQKWKACVSFQKQFQAYSAKCSVPSERCSASERLQEKTGMLGTSEKVLHTVQDWTLNSCLKQTPSKGHQSWRLKQFWWSPVSDSVDKCLNYFQQLSVSTSEECRAIIRLR